MNQTRPIRVFLADERIRGRSRARTSACQVDGCRESTREGKPYCPEHIDRLDYVARIQAQLEEREAEVAEVAKRGWKAVNIDGPIVKEILMHMRMKGTQTVERMAREVAGGQLSDVIEQYVEALVRKRLVKLGTTQRGSTAVSPV